MSLFDWFPWRPAVTFAQNVRTIYVLLTTTTLKVDTILMNIAAQDVRLQRRAAKTLVIDDGAGGAALLAVSAVVKGAASGPISAVLTVNTTAQGTPASTIETDLWSYVMPANTLNVDAKAVRITAWGTKAANADNVTPRLYFGGTQIAGTVFSTSGSRWTLSAIVARTGVTAQAVHAGMEWQQSGTSFTNSVDTAAADTTAPIPIKVTGQNAVANLNDMVFRGAIVEALN